jgi:glucan phosphoethanolaminetransferase (alkaline phosphatase superfamily)
MNSKNDIVSFILGFLPLLVVLVVLDAILYLFPLVWVLIGIVFLVCCNLVSIGSLMWDMIDYIKATHETETHHYRR